MNTLIPKIKRLSVSTILPKRATEGAVAYDVFVPQDTVVKKGRQVIPLGFAIELPNCNYEAKIEPRSGFSSKGMEGYERRIVYEHVFDTRLVGGVSKKMVEYIAAQPDRFNADVLVGKIDSDYRGEVGVIIKSDDDKEFIIKAGTRIAQMTFYNVPETVFTEVEELTETGRKGGFGSTGV